MQSNINSLIFFNHQAAIKQKGQKQSVQKLKTIYIKYVLISGNEIFSRIRQDPSYT